MGDCLNRGDGELVFSLIFVCSLFSLDHREKLELILPAQVPQPSESVMGKPEVQPPLLACARGMLQTRKIHIDN